MVVHADQRIFYMRGLGIYDFDWTTQSSSKAGSCALRSYREPIANPVGAMQTDHCYGPGSYPYYGYISSIECPDDQAYLPGGCKKPKEVPEGLDLNTGKKICLKGPSKGAKAPEVSIVVGNPIHIVTGNKYQEATDFIGIGPFPLKFQRFYNSKQGAWRYSYMQHLSIGTFATTGSVGLTRLRPVRASGKVSSFSRDMTSSWSSSTDLTGRIEITANSIRYIKADDITEEYDLTGKLVSIKNRQGVTQTLTYSGNNNETVTVAGPNGQTLIIQTNGNDQLVSMTDPGGNIYRYAYDAQGNLSTVTFPGGGIKKYLYENTSLPNALTGVIDENDDRFATWNYDSSGRAISSEHANGSDKTTLDFTNVNDVSAPRVTVTNSLDKKTTYHYTTINGIHKITKVEGHQSPNCVAANHLYSYDNQGLLSSQTDWEGNTTTFEYDNLGREVRRVEASNTPQERITTTEWHSEYNLPVSIQTGNHVTNMIYDASGNLIKRTTGSLAP